MSDNNKPRTLSVLEAFYQREAEQATDICFIQPVSADEVVEYSWRETADQARRVAAFLRSLNLEAGSRIALMSTNCANWIMADLAIWMAGHISVPIYPVLTGGSVRQILDHSGAKVMFAGKLEKWPEIATGIDEDIQLISFPLASSVPDDIGKRWNDILVEFEPIADNPIPDLDELATIIYTSGTTGMPKGVMHSFKNLATVGTASGQMYGISTQDRKLSYLPLAHVGERASVEVNHIYHGYRVFFSYSLATFGEDLRRARPTLFFAVPRIWQKFQQQVNAKIANKRLQRLLKLPFIGKRVRKKVLEGMGMDAMRIAISGAAPLSTSLINWYRSLGIEILEGYGMSENFAFSHATRSGESRVGYVGTPSMGVECRIAESGEILVKTPAATLGYYKEPELSAELFDDDGFIRTGDRGEIDAQGRLRITGRIKEIFKTSKGKYVAPAPIEDMLSQSDDIELVCVTGANMPQPLALVVLTEESKELSKTEGGMRELAKRLLQTLSDTNGKLDKHENISHIVIVGDEWTLEAGLITPTLKVKRAQLEERYSGHFANWQRQSQAVVWAEPVL
ncbi:AMP-binding protein [Spongiibacter marinus]|uniref:AMP-binding protein n=1 Tax=Spongiibacter marinus TaxID=354246 RepID=UPI0035BE76AE